MYLQFIFSFLFVNNPLFRFWYHMATMKYIMTQQLKLMVLKLKQIFSKQAWQLDTHFLKIVCL